MKRLLRSRVVVAVAIGLALAASACDGDAPDAPYVEFAGGGFVFNFRLAQVTYGFLVTPKRKMPEGTILEAEFENPAGGPAFTARQTVTSGSLQYAFASPPVKGVKADTPYKATIRVIDPGTGKVLAQYQRTFEAQIDQSVLGKKPRTVGPGYHPNPELRPTPRGDPLKPR